MLTKHPGQGIRNLHVILIFLAVFIVYLWSAPRTVVLEDDGLFILASYFNGIAHPPGYPLFTLFGHLSTLIPVGSVAYRVHMLSGLFGALSCIVLYLISVELKLEKFYAGTAALALGLSQVFWSQSIIAEVYTLNVLLILILFLLAIRWVENKDRVRKEYEPYLMGFIFGLGLSNHWPLVLLSTPMLLVIILPRWRALVSRLHFVLLFVIAGLTPYIWMYYRSQMDPTISFYGPLESLWELWFVISRQGYAGTDVNAAAGLWDKLEFTWFVLRETFFQHGVIGGIFVILGSIVQWKTYNKRICIALLTGYLGSTLLLILLLGFEFDLLHKNVFKVYPLIPYVMTTLWMIIGIRSFSVFIRENYGKKINGKYSAQVICLFVLLTEFFTNLPLNYRAEDNLAYYYAHTILESLDENAVFFTMSDMDTPTLGYFNLIEKVRPDVTLYHNLGLIYSNRLYDRIYTSDDRRHEILSEFLRNEDRPVYYLGEMPHLYGYEYYGIYRKINKDQDKGKTVIVAREDILNFLERVLERNKSYDLWEDMLQRALISDYCRITTHLYDLQRNDQPDYVNPLEICRGYLGLLTLADVMLTVPNPDAKSIKQVLEKASRLRSDSILREDFAKYDILYGKLLLLEDRKEDARRYFEKAVEAWPDPKNDAYDLLQAD